MRISVGVCTHNGEKFIREQLECILNQTVKPDEIIVTDDNSSDNTVEIVNSLLNDSGINHKVVPYDTHQGILKNFQNCLDMCTGDVIFSCDQDDVWMKDKIEKFIPYFERGSNFVYSNAIVVDSERNILEDNFWKCYGIDFCHISKDEFQLKVLSNLFIAGCNMAFTKDLYDKIRPIPYHFLHDGWVASCAPLFGDISFIDVPLIEYRRHGNNTSQFQSDEKLSDENSVVSVKQEKKKSIINDIYKNTLPDDWFGNHHNYVCNKLFYERMSTYMTNEYSKIVLKSISFHKNLLNCLPKHRIKSICILLREFFNGNYGLFRGNYKSLIRDFIFIIFNKNKDFEHDLNKW